jgi:hypothetical protein
MENKNQKQAKANIKTARKQAVQQAAEAVENNSGLNAPSGSELAKAQKEGVAEAVKESAKDAYQSLTDGTLPGAPPARQFTGMDDIQQYAGILDLDPIAFEDAVKEQPKNRPAIGEEKIAGLLSLERAGKNRTPYVRALMHRLDISHPHEVTTAGPGYTNDIHPVTDLGERA